MADAFGAGGKVAVAVITGGHAFDVPRLHQLFRSMPQVDAYVQTLDDWIADCGSVRERYDVRLFYNMHRDVPPPDAKYWGKAVRATLESLGRTRQGILLLHHAIFAWPGWPFWDDLVGIGGRDRFSYHIGETVPVRVAAPEHPITRGLADWTMIDETYKMADAGEGSEILLATDHPRSMRTLAWTRQVGQARVFCFQSGHDDRTWTVPGFREVLARGILWCAGRL